MLRRVCFSKLSVLKYFSTPEKLNSLKAIFVNAEPSVIHNMNAVVSGTLHARDFVNEPYLI